MCEVFHSDSPGQGTNPKILRFFFQRKRENAFLFFVCTLKLYVCVLVECIELQKYPRNVLAFQYENKYPFS